MSVSTAAASVERLSASAAVQSDPAASAAVVQAPAVVATGDAGCVYSEHPTLEALDDEEEFPGQGESSRPYIAVPLAPPKPMIRCNSQTPLQWLRQTYQQQWKGSIDIRTVEAEDHAPRNPHWCCFMTASGAVVKDKGDRNVTLDSIEVETEGRTKKAAEQLAAEKIREILVEQGWYDPSQSSGSKKGRVGRANKFMVDSVLSNEANPLAYLDVSIDGDDVGRVVVELFRYKKGTTLDDHAPLAVENFLALCRGVEIDGQQYSYVGVPFTRIVPRFLLQTGDVVNKDGTGGIHVHTCHGGHFPDEGLDDRNYRHNRPFMLSVANLGIENSNSSQFFITVAPTVELDGHHTCFGKVLAGYGVIKQVEALGEADKPSNNAIISGCGELPSGYDYSSTPSLMAAGWPLWPEDQGPPPEGMREARLRLDIATALKETGNEAYLKGDDTTALARYHQAVRYLNWTTFKIRTLSGEVDMESPESAALWDMEVLLMGNIAAAQLRLKQYRAAADSCDEILRRNPYHVKALLRAAQAHLHLGWAEYDTAEGYLNRAQQQATAQDLQTQVKEVEILRRRLHNSRKQHKLKLRAKFSAAFNDGLLHHPADDDPTIAAAAADDMIGSNQLSIQQFSHDRLCSLGAVSRERVLNSRQPVLVDDAWGTHVLMADGGTESDHSCDSQHQAGSVLYRPGLTARLPGLQMPDGQHCHSSDAGTDDNKACVTSQWHHGDSSALSSQQVQDIGQQNVGVTVGDVDNIHQAEGVNSHHSVAQTATCDMQAAAAATDDERRGIHAMVGSFGVLQLQQSSMQEQQQEPQHTATAAPQGVSAEYQEGHAGAQGGVVTSAQYGAGALQALPKHGVGGNTKVVVP